MDQNGKRNSWEAVVKIPFIDEAKLVDVLSTIDHRAELTKEERLRNMPGVEHTHDSPLMAEPPPEKAPPSGTKKVRVKKSAKTKPKS